MGEKLWYVILGGGMTAFVRPQQLGLSSTFLSMYTALPERGTSRHRSPRYARSCVVRRACPYPQSLETGGQPTCPVSVMGRRNRA